MLRLSKLWALALFALPLFAQDPAEETPVESAEPTAGRCPTIPPQINLTPLNNPFEFEDGRPVRTKEDWSCRRAEIAEFAQRYVLGSLPKSRPKVVGELIEVAHTTRPYSINVTVTEGDKTIFFTVPIEVEKDLKKPVPAIITLGAASLLPKLDGVASILFNNDLIAQQQGQSSRGKGLFYDLYGEDHPAGAMIAWAWGVGRLIDALEQVQGKSPINAKRLGVTGCSRNGKGTVIVGAFEPRIALTIPHESGAGGTSCWRIQDALKNSGSNVQTAAQIVTENVWHAKAFETYVNKVGILPYDQHLLTALIAPRAVLSLEKASFDWLGPEGAWGCQRAARTVYKALDVEDHIGFLQLGQEHEASHCWFPEEQLPGLQAFVDRFLKGERVRTGSYFETEAEFPKYSDKFWIRWSTPRLR